jgi:hypothetical protein
MKNFPMKFRKLVRDDWLCKLGKVNSVLVKIIKRTKAWFDGLIDLGSLIELHPRVISLAIGTGI